RGLIEREGEGREYLPGVGPAAGAVAAAGDPRDEERVGLQGEDIVVALGDIGEIEPRAPVPQELLRPTCRPGPQYPVVDLLDPGCERLGIVIVERPQRQCSRACDRRGPGARGSVGEELGVALVEPDDGVTPVPAR